MLMSINEQNPAGGLSERNHSLPSALRREAEFLHQRLQSFTATPMDNLTLKHEVGSLARRFRSFATDLKLAAAELEELRTEAAFLRAGILQAIERDSDRVVILTALWDSPRHRDHDGLVG
jgi:hypothetical protein